MKVLLFSLLFTVCLCAPQGRYIFDFLRQPLTAAEVETILSSRDANAYPQYDVNSLPRTTFSCAQQSQPGYYADVETQCQVFHRCDLQGNLTTYICVNTTIFNQLTLVCDAWYNVDCGLSGEYSSFANSRLYTNQPLFDTPPADYVIQNQNKAAVSQPANKIKITPLKINQAPVVRTIPIQIPVVNLTGSGRSDVEVPNEVAQPVALVPLETSQPAGTRFVVVRTP